MKESEKETSVIKFEEFSISQLQELTGKKQEIKGVIDANPIIEVIDNNSYELAKKSRTAVKTLRTSLEKEKKDVNDKIRKNVLEVIANEYDLLIESVKNDEIARQEHVTTWENKKELERQEKARLEQERIQAIKEKISDFKNSWETKISQLTFDKIAYQKGLNFLNLEDIKLANDETWLRELEDAKNVKEISEIEVIEPNFESATTESKKEEVIVFDNLDAEPTWNDIFELFKSENKGSESLSYEVLIDWLCENYNAPSIKK